MSRGAVGQCIFKFENTGVTPMAALYDFLQKNQIQLAQALPLVHSTEAYFIKKVMASGSISASPCKFFHSENLSYFFVGRPAFKRLISREAEYWELPMCFIFDFNAFTPKRVFPFDSGAFQSGLYPEFLSMMQLDDFEVSADKDAAQKIIGTFFANPRAYFNLKPRDSSDFEAAFDVDVLDEEIKALHKLISYKDGAVDDRRFAIECQCDHDLVLKKSRVLAVILPESYIENESVVTFVEKELDASLITYPIFALKKEFYYYAIYEKVEAFLRQKGYFDVQAG